MPPSSLDTHTAQFTEIIGHLIRLKSRLKALLPEDEDAAHVKARLLEFHPGGKVGSIDDFSLLYNIGLILSRQQEPMTMGELSQALDVPFSTATRIMDWLVKNDYAERRSDPNDRRIVRVTLTEMGQVMYRILNEHIRKRIEHLLRPFTAEERESLVALLNKLVRALEEET